jgi:hypothetical protein
VPPPHHPRGWCTAPPAGQTLAISTHGGTTPERHMLMGTLLPSLPPDEDPPAICEISPLVSYSGEVRALVLSRVLQGLEY